jgi:peroxiredoxin
MPHAPESVGLVVAAGRRTRWLWPCVYLIDKSGNVRQRWEGEPRDGGAKKLSAVIDELRKEPSPKGK